MLLVGDIGGTKTLLASVNNKDLIDNSTVLNSIKSYKSCCYKNFELILKDYLDEQQLTNIDAISLAVAGPVNSNYSELTNLNWVIDASFITRQVKTNNVHIYNDLESIAAAVCHDHQGLDIINLNQVTSHEESHFGSKAIIAPGTGLGMAYAIYNNGRYIPTASQGGHINFAPTTQLQYELLCYMQKKIILKESAGSSDYTQVGLELVCSGIGIPNILNFFREAKHIAIDGLLEQQLSVADDWVPVIISNALEDRCRLSIMTVELFIDILANAVQTMALTVFAKGGIYLAGGIAVALKDYLTKKVFLDGVIANYTMQSLLEKMPLYLCQNKNIALIGASKLLNTKNKINDD